MNGDHGVQAIDWNATDRGFRGVCMCGFETSLSGKIEFIGAEFDEHFEEQL